MQYRLIFMAKQFEYNILPDAYDALIYLEDTSASEVL